MLKEFNITLDISKHKNNPVYTFSTSDWQSLKFLVTVQNDDVPVDLTGITPRIAIKKTDKTTILQDGTVTDAINGKCEFLLTSQAYVIGGFYKAEVMLYEGTEQVATTNGFTYMVSIGVMNIELESKDDWPTLSKAIEAGENEPTRITAEETRVANENVRITSEQARQINEESRQTALAKVVTATENATTQADFAKTQGDYAKTEADRVAGMDVSVLTTQLADIANVINLVDVTKFGATPNSLADQTPYIQAAINYIKSMGWGHLYFPDGVYRIIADENTTTFPYNPKRVEIRGYVTGEEIIENGVPVSDTREVHYVENIRISGAPNAIIYMTGMTEEYLRNQDDIAQSNVDIFCAFSFAYAKNCHVSDIKIRGDYLVEGIPFRYGGGVSQARAKAISFSGCIDCSVYHVDSRYILGNHVHVNSAANSLDGYWMPSEGIDIYNNHFDTCLEIGVNLTTIAPRSRVADNTILHANGCGIEGPAIITGNTVKDCKGGGISPSADAAVFGNTIENVSVAFLLSGTASLSHAQHINTTISNNTVKNIRNKFIYIYAGSGNAIITGNKFINSNLEDDTSTAIEMMVLLGGSQASPIKNVNMTDNYFEIDNAASFVNYGIYSVYVQDSFIKYNQFVSVKELTADIYVSNNKGNTVKYNKLTKGISASSDNYERNNISDNEYPTSTYPITVDWIYSTPPSSGSWKVGDFLKKPPVAIVKGEQRNIELGWRCVSVSPLTWETVYANNVRYESNLPTSGTWTKGEIIQNAAPTYGSVTGWVCLLSGTLGTLSGVTGSINNGESTLIVNTVSTMKIGDYITIAGVTGAKRIVSISGTTIILNSTANATVTGAAVTFNAPTIAPYGLVDLQGSVTWNPATIANGQGATSPNIDFSYVALGDFVIVSAPYDLQGLICTAYVVSAGRVKIRIHNATGADVTLASGTWKVKVIKS